MSTRVQRLPSLVRRDPWLAGLVALAAVDLAVLAPRLVYADLGLDYPFLGGDSFDWLLNALALTGEPVRSSFRPPALPLALALLMRLGWLSWFPVLSLALHHVAAAGAHLALRRRFGRPVAFTCGLLVLTSASLLPMALEVMADLPAAILLGASCAAFLAAGRRPGFYLWAGLLGGLSAVTQQAALLLPLPAGVTVLAFRRGDLRSARLWLGSAAFAALPVAWFVAKRFLAGTFLDVGIQQWSLLGFHPENALHYLVAALSFWGWPALLLTAAGAAASLRDLARRPSAPGDAAWALFPLLTAAVLLGFFALFYDFQAKRFLVYAFFPSLALLARGLAALRGRRLLGAAAAVLTVAVGAWPLPRPELASHATLWPVPTVYSVVPGGRFVGGAIQDAPEARVKVARPAWALRRSAWGRVLRASRRRAASPAVALPALEDVGVTIFLGGSGPREPSRWKALTQLGYLVRRPVTHVSQRLYPKDWWGWRGLEPVGVVDRYRVFRLRVPGMAEAAAVAFERRSPLGLAVGRRARLGEGLAPRPEPARLQEAMALARDVAALCEGRHQPVVLLPEARGEWARLLPFLVDGVLWLPDPAEAARIASAVGEPGPAVTRVGPLRVDRRAQIPYPVTLVFGGPAP
ncbi:MAG TPA: hypothetical protein VM599_00550 [Thermoanaerobaculia bacterium]|nr:hypothetical protein [Thermoanaerobaculia bacterium]